MAAPPTDERDEVLQPSLLSVPDNSSKGLTASEHYCVSTGVRDGAGPAVNNNDTNIIITSLHLTITVLHI